MDGVEDLKLTFTFDLRIKEEQEKIIKEIKSYSSKVYNTFNYEVRERKVDVSKIERVNQGSSIDKEEINRENYNKARRIKRGLFKTNSGKIINADVNGSINILRKYIKEVFSPNLEIAMDIGREQRPLKKRVA